MTKAHQNDDGSLTFEDPVRHIKIDIYDHEGDLCFSPPPGSGAGFWMRASDAASVGDWLRRTFADADWRIGAAPEHTSIPLDAAAGREPSTTVDWHRAYQRMYRDVAELIGKDPGTGSELIGCLDVKLSDLRAALEVRQPAGLAGQFCDGLREALDGWEAELDMQDDSVTIGRRHQVTELRKLLGPRLP